MSGDVLFMEDRDGLYLEPNPESNDSCREFPLFWRVASLLPAGENGRRSPLSAMITLATPRSSNTSSS
jgi:hypothetical protein